MRHVIIFLLAASLCLPVHSQQTDPSHYWLNNIEIQQFSTPSSFPHDGVNTIHQSANGFLWFGTVEGLFRYDGYRFISYATWYIENEVRKTAYGYLRNKCVSLDKPLGTDDDSPTRKDYLCARPCQSTDWNLRYRDALERLKRHAEERQYGLGRLTAELHQMLLEGYTTSDFARRHRLTESQMNRLLTILREEADGSLHIAA